LSQLSVSKLEENKNINPTPTQSTCLYYDHDNVASKCVNSLNFKIEASAISKIPLIQNEWNTKPQVNDVVPEDRKIVNTITWNDLKQKHNMNFNVLVVDCKGALYNILKDEPEFLNGFETIII
jgi:hypothetical protein